VTATKSGEYREYKESLTYFPAGVIVFQQFDDVSLMAA